MFSTCNHWFQAPLPPVTAVDCEPPICPPLLTPPTSSLPLARPQLIVGCSKQLGIGEVNGTCHLLQLRYNYANKSTMYRMLCSEEQGYRSVSTPIAPYLILSAHTTSGGREPIGLAWVRRRHGCSLFYYAKKTYLFALSRRSSQSSDTRTPRAGGKSKWDRFFIRLRVYLSVR